MKLKRLAASINATFEDFVNRVENHAAVAEHVLAEVRNAAARLKVELARVQAQLSQLDARRNTLAEERDRWRQRAVRFAASDAGRALECVSRLEKCEASLAAIEREYAAHGRLADDIRTSLADVEQKLRDLELRKTSLGSRSARADAMRTLDERGASHEAERIFERWEVHVASDEYRHGMSPVASDPLERELDAAESEAALKERLAALVAEAHTASSGEAS